MISEVCSMGKEAKWAPSPGHHIIWRIIIIWTTLVEVHPWNICAKLFKNQTSDFWQEDIWSLLYNHIGKMGPAPWQPCFLTDQNNFNNHSIRSPKEHLCQIIFKSAQWFPRRRFFWYFYYLPLCDPYVQWSETIWIIFREGPLTNIQVKFGWK